MIALLGPCVCVAIFGAAGWLGAIVADAWYGATGSARGGARSTELPVWVLAGAAACLGARVTSAAMPPLSIGIALLAVLALIVCTQTDLRSRFIPDAFSIGPLLLVLSVAAYRHDAMPLWGALFAVVPFGALAFVSRGRGMGWGDVKFAALGGSLVGIGGIVPAVCLASLAAVVVGVKERRLRRPIAFGPYLAAAIGLALFVVPPV